MRSNFMTRATVLGIATLVLGSGWTASHGMAQVNVNVNIGSPPPVVVRSAPTMLFLPEPGFYVAVGVPYDIYFTGGHYYYLHGDHWFWASGYNGPWVHVSPSFLPPGLRKFKIAKLRSFRDHEYGRYRASGPDFRGKHFLAVGSNNGNKHGRGRGNH
jgi:hypothetical protein